ncbi:MAG: FAD binding domain-containing protein [Candidatus Binatia bacterium]
MDLQFPSSLDEACELLSRSSGEGRLIAGGVALMVLIRHQLFFPSRLISIKRIPGLDQIRFDESKGLSIGALVTHHQVESFPLVRQYYPALAGCIRHVGNLRVRNMGTLIGDLCQADNHSDPTPLLSVLGASIRTRSTQGERIIPIEQFHRGIYETELNENEIAIEVMIPPPHPGTRIEYLRFSGNSPIDWPTLGVAGSLTLEDGQCRDLKIFVGCLTEVPVSLNQKAGALKGKRLTSGRVKKFAESCASEIEPLSDAKGSTWYKKRLAAVYIRRTVEKLLRKKG